MAFSNGISCTIRIPFKVKQAGFRALRNQGKPTKRATLLLFAAAVYLLLKENLDQLQRIVVDNEYDGRQSDIRSFLFEYVRRDYPRFRIHKIVVQSIGKKSNAHRLAWAARKGKHKADRTISKKELLAVVA